MKKLIWLFLVIFSLALLSGRCAPSPKDQAVDPSQAPVTENYYCKHPDSDNGNSFGSNASVCYDTRVYKLTVKVLGELASNQTTNGSISGFSTGSYGSVSGRIWTEGKGVLPVQILEMSPETNWLDISKPNLVKTTDLKAMGLPVGAITQIICMRDVEVLSAVFPGQTLTTDRLTNELDNCRLVSPTFSLN